MGIKQSSLQMQLNPHDVWVKSAKQMKSLQGKDEIA